MKKGLKIAIIIIVVVLLILLAISLTNKITTGKVIGSLGSVEQKDLCWEYNNPAGSMYDSCKECDAVYDSRGIGCECKDIC